LPAIAVGQLAYLLLTHRYRRQASSHIDRAHFELPLHSVAEWLTTYFPQLRLCQPISE
jgi:hypothetical protein